MKDVYIKKKLYGDLYKYCDAIIENALAIEEIPPTSTREKVKERKFRNMRRATAEACLEFSSYIEHLTKFLNKKKQRFFGTLPKTYRNDFIRDCYGRRTEGE